MFDRSPPRRCALAVAALLTAAGCASPASGVTSASDGERGPITYVAGKDPGGSVRKQLDRWNRSHPGEEVTFIELPADPDAQRQQMIQNAHTRSDAFTVLSLDAVWTAEFAANRWVDELPAERFEMDRMLPPIKGTATYKGKLFAAPSTSDGALLYYRSDLLQRAGIHEPPRTWPEMRAACEKVLALPGTEDVSCFSGQYEKREILTVNFAEAVESAGGAISDAEGNPTVNTPEAKAGLDFLADGYRSGLIPRESVTFQEEQSRRPFQEGKLLFHRQWPYQYELISKTDGSSAVAGKFDVAPLPGANGPGVSSLGGHNLALASSARNKATALDFMDYVSDEAGQRQHLLESSQAPTHTSLYDDPALVRKFPYLPALKASILGAEPRPRIVRYGEATKAVQRRAYQAITGAAGTAEALAALQDDLERITR